MPLADSLSAQLDRLAALEPGPFPVISLYLNAQPDQHGRDHFEPFLRKELAQRIRTFPADGPERESLDKDGEQIRAFLTTVDASVNGVAIFASAGAGLFETIELAAPIDEHRLFISSQPHLYPLARALDQHPRYAVLMADSHFSRIFVVAANTVEATEQVAGTKTRRHKMGGWSQARYQRHIENYHQQHAKEVVETLTRIVRDESVGAIVIAGDQVAVSLITAELPKDIAARVVDVVKINAHSAEREIVEATIETMRQNDAETDRARVEELLGAYRADGLAVVGVDETLRALEMGQVDELVIAATPDVIDPGQRNDAANDERSPAERTADELIAKARQTAATVRFIEDPALLSGVGGVGAFLRFKL